MRALKVLLRRPFAREAVSLCCALYLRFAWRTGRWRESGEIAGLRDAISRGEPVILAAWHGRLACPPVFLPAGCRPAAMASRHADGDLLAGVLRRLSVEVIAGSSGKHGKGAASALRGAVRALRQGRPVAVTPDGPGGPRMRAKPGAVAAATAAQACVYPVTFSCVGGIGVASWDRFLLPGPFTRGVVSAGKPIRSDRVESTETLTAELEKELNRLTLEADLECGRRPVRRAPYTRRPEGKKWRNRKRNLRRALRRAWPARIIGL